MPPDLPPGAAGEVGRAAVAVATGRDLVPSVALDRIHDRVEVFCGEKGCVATLTSGLREPQGVMKKAAQLVLFNGDLPSQR